MIQRTNFAFMFHLMLELLMMINYFNSSLKKMDKDTMNAMRLLNNAKYDSQRKRDSGQKSLLSYAFSFYHEHEIATPKKDVH